jgi:hypothetical protein
LEYYQFAFDFSWVKVQVNYRIRFSLFYTLACKHKKSLKEIIKLFSKNVCVYWQNKVGELELIIRFLTSHEISNYCLSSIALGYPVKKDEDIKQFLIQFFLFKVVYKDCCIKSCSEKVIVLHNVKSLYKKMSRIVSSSFVKKYKLKKLGFKALKLTFSWKHISFCKFHNKVFYQNKLYLNDFKCSYVFIKFDIWNNNRIS